MNASPPQALSTAPHASIVSLTSGDTQALEAVRALFQEYAAALGIDLCFQNFAKELATLPGDYVEPRGALLLALVEITPEPLMGDEARMRLVPGADGQPAWAVGCCALRPLDATDYPNAAEMKRLYVRPAFRSRGLGLQLAEAILDTARHAGYSSVLLDTLDDMEAARDLYEELGFVEIPPYYHNPIAGAHYLKVDL